MNCKNCGTVLSSTSKFCLNCGMPVENVLEKPVVLGELSSMTPQTQDGVVEPSVTISPVQTNEIPVELFAPVTPMQPVEPVVQTPVSLAQPVQTSEIPAELFAPVAPMQSVEPIIQPTISSVQAEPTVVQPVQTNEIPVELFTPVPEYQSNLVTKPELEFAQTVVPESQPVELLVPTENVKEQSIVVESNVQIPTTIPGVPNPVFPDTLVEPIRIEEQVVPAANVQNNTAVIEQGIIETPTTGLPVGEPKPIPTVPVAPVTPTQAVVSSMPAVVPQPTQVHPVQQSSDEQVQPSKDNKLLYFIIGLVIVTAIIVAILFFIFGGKGEEETTVNSGNNTPATPVVEVPKYDFVQGKFKYRIPTKYTAQEQEGYIALYNNTYYIEFAASEGYNFTMMTEADAKAVIENMKATVITSKITNKNGRDYAVVRAVYNGVDCVFILDKSATNYAMVGFGYKLDYTYDEQLESEIIAILESVKYSPTSNLSSKVDIDLFQLFQQ